MKNLVFLKTVYIIIGLCLLSNAVVATLISNFNAGVLATYIIGSCAFVYGVLLDKALKLPLGINISFCVLVTLGFSMCLALILYGKVSTVTYKEDAVIILGAGIKGETVGNSLGKRLDTAVEYYEKNNEALIVVSGGQGKYEDISEALAMERYLTARGVPKQNIIKEDKSTSTAENFAFSKKLLDEKLGEGYTVAYISNGFHIFRAGLTAKRTGFEAATHLGAPTPWYLIIPSTFRECMATVRYFMG